MFRRVRLFLSVVTISCAACVPAGHDPAAPSAATRTSSQLAERTPDATHAEPPTATMQSRPPTVPSPIVTSAPEPELTMTDYWLRTTQAVDQLMTMTAPEVRRSYVSPDGKWRVDIVIRDCTKVDPRPSADENSLEQLVLVDRQRANRDVMLEQFLYCGGLGAYGFDGLRWSADGRYFYFTPAKNGGPDGVCWYWERPIDLIDTQHHEVVPLGGGPDSPDGTRVALWQADELVIWDYDLGEIQRVPAWVSGASVGPKAWAPDSRQLVYLQSAANCMSSGESTLVSVDAVSGAQKEILRSTEPGFAYVDWVEPDALRLRTFNGEDWRFTLSTGKLAPEPQGRRTQIGQSRTVRCACRAFWFALLAIECAFLKDAAHAYPTTHPGLDQCHRRA